MWLAPVTTAAPATEPLTLDDVREYLRIDTTDFDGQITGWITAARAQVERITGTRLITQTVKLQASAFSDLVRLPIGPVVRVASLAYQDPTGAAQALDPSAFELFGGGIEWGLRPIVNTLWPLARVAEGAIAVTWAPAMVMTAPTCPAPCRPRCCRSRGGCWLERRSM